MSLHPNPGVRADPLKRAGLKATLPRMRILEVFLAAQAAPDGLRHFTAEDVYRRMLHERTDVGQATVYRVLAQLEQAGLLRRSSFQADRAVYELDDGLHHDHLVCLDCGKVEEFHDASIESRQAEIAHAKGFRLQEHALSLYGTCTLAQCPSRPQRAKA
ncbi:MAG: ferric iron uptake transcriptional regulator [Acidovorax sp.]|uniref:ferric iron uptake transcriptional regulator n=1 Tax=Acidovorax sp. TaxID=1872122 RepID=UPI00391939D7